MTVERRVRCDGGEHCQIMNEMLDVADDNRRGFSGVTTLNIKESVMRYIGVRYCKTAKRSDKGIMLNFCPFCGASIQWWERP